MKQRSHPVVIQGGVGTAVSAWQLAKAVSITGRLGDVLGTVLDVVVVRWLRSGESGGPAPGALAEFPRVTCGDHVKNLAQFLPTPETQSNTARDVVNYLMSFVTGKPSIASC